MLKELRHRARKVCHCHKYRWGKLAATLAVWLPLQCFMAASDQRDLLTRRVFLMGTSATLSTYSDTRSRAMPQLESFIELLSRLDAELSTWQQESVISRLNRWELHRPFVLDSELCSSFGEIQRWSLKTGRAFDPAIGNLVNAWDVHGTGRTPNRLELGAALARSGFHFLSFDPESCSVMRLNDVTIDSGAFGKGLALDRIKESCAKRDCTPWLINLGGQVAVFGNPPDNSSWEVEIADPLERSRALLVLQLRSGSIAVSGISARDRKVSGRRISHILDPRTGEPSAFQGAVAVWHDRALVADILSTALFVLGLEEGLAWADEHGLAACFLVPEPDGGVRLRFSATFGEVFPDVESDRNY